MRYLAIDKLNISLRSLVDVNAKLSPTKGLGEGDRVITRAASPRVVVEPCEVVSQLANVHPVCAFPAASCCLLPLSRSYTSKPVGLVS